MWNKSTKVQTVSLNRIDRSHHWCWSHSSLTAPNQVFWILRKISWNENKNSRIYCPFIILIKAKTLHSNEIVKRERIKSDEYKKKKAWNFDVMMTGATAMAVRMPKNAKKNVGINEINVNHLKMLVDVKCLSRKVSIHSLSSQSGSQAVSQSTVYGVRDAHTLNSKNCCGMNSSVVCAHYARQQRQSVVGLFQI